MNSPSKMVVDRQRSTLDLAALATENVEKVTPELAQLFETHVVDAEIVPDLGLLQTLMARALHTRLATLVTQDKAQIDQHTAEAVPRRLREQAVERVRESLLALRRAAEAHFGDLSVELVPIFKETAKVPEALWRQAEHTLERFDDPDRPLPPTLVPGLPTDLTPWLSDLRGATDDLRTALDDLAVARARTTSTYDLKAASMNTLDREVRSIVRVLEGLYGLAGRPELAETIRRPLRRPNQSGSEEPGAPESGAPEPGAPEPSSASEPAGSEPAGDVTPVN